MSPSKRTSPTANSIMPTMVLLLALVATFIPFTAAHSWIEEYQLISPNGSFVGARGYSRGYVSRADPTFTGNSDMWMLPSLEARNSDGTVRTRINSSDLICHPAQRTANYTADYPRLKVQPGDYVAMKYLENGHVTLPWNITGKPAGGGTIFVFGTTSPAADEKIADVMEWNTKGTGGNKRGWLMTAQNYDDGRCHQLNCGSLSQQRQMLSPNHVADQPTSTVESWCETDLKIPETVKAGSLTTYWVWQWPTEPNADCNQPAGKDEYYTTCADFDVVSGSGSGSKVNQKVALAPFSAGPGANPQSIAVKNFMSRTAYTPTPTAVLMNNNRLVGAVSTVASSFVSSCSAKASVISANNLGVWPEVFVPNTCSVVTSFGTAAASSAAAAFASMASSYSAGSSSAWSAAFAAAKVPLMTNAPWSLPPETQAAGTGASGYSTPAAETGSTPLSAPVAITSTRTAAPYANTTSSAVADVTTVTTVIVITSTLPAGQAAPTYAESSSSSESASSASSSSAVAITSTSTAPANTYGVHTIMTISGSATASDNEPAIPTVGANGTVYRRAHPRNFRRWW